MLSGMLRGESLAVDTHPALSTSDSIVWTDRALMRPDQVCAASRYGGYSGATLRHPVGDRPCRPLTCGSDGRPWRCDRPGVLPPRCSRGPLGASRHTTPLAGLPRGADLMRRTPLMPGGEVLLLVGERPYTPGADHRSDTVPDARHRAGRTGSARPEALAWPRAGARDGPGTARAPLCGSDGTAHSTAPRGSGGLAQAAASAEESPRLARASAEAQDARRQPPPAGGER